MRLFLLTLLFIAADTVLAAGRVNFSLDVQPILSDRCYACHGPDEKARKGKLRLDRKEDAFAPRKDGALIIKPGDPANSELVRRILSRDPDEVMPPPQSHLSLTADEVEALTAWVRQGAEWGRHWAFEPIHRPAVPSVSDSSWPVNDLDRFVLSRLDRLALKPAAPADKERLVRRVTLDLTGLPPTPAELDAFLADPSVGAYEKVVSRLLASTAYGERMAAEWLDIARYSDTHGYQMDRYRPMWPYRDWVIKAFNENLPFDQFVTWQLAGDLLPNASKDQRLATAFNRLHLQNEEGGIVEEEFRVSYVVDRVNTFGTAFLGLTFECSRCHDHKFDPISQRDFYQLFSLFQNIDESGQTVYFGDIMPVPTLLLSTQEQDARLKELRGRIRAKEDELRAAREAARPAFADWLKSKPTAPEVPDLAAAYSFDELKENKFSNQAETNHPANAVEGPRLVPGKLGQAVELNGENGVTFPGAGAFTRADPFSLSLWINVPAPAPRMVILHKARAWMDAGSRGYDLLVEDGRLAVGLYHMWPGNALKIRTQSVMPTNEWTHVAITYDGSSRAAGLRLFVNGLPAAVDVLRDSLWRDITYGGGEPDLAIGYRMRDSGFKGGKVDELRIYKRALSGLEVAHLAGRDDLRAALADTAESLPPARRDALFDYFCGLHHEPVRHLGAELTQLRREQNQLVMSIQDIMVMQELPQPKPAFILKRGAYDAPGEAVTGDTPHALPPLPGDAPRNRLGLARWLTSADNPLMARVTVNRAWQLMFGRGLVETADNFGSQGALPTHPELLDWLAVEFRESGWDYKSLLRLIALSATYQQSSKASPELLARDPDNKLLARGPAKRLSAEMLRDQALAVSGLLAPKIGGPSVKPYQPSGLWEIAMGNPRYELGKGDDLHRRSLYTFWKRTVPPPAMITFDAAERNVCVARRQNTSTPLQALALLNDVQIVEAARYLAERTLREGGPTPEDQAAYAFRLVTGRHPNPRELAILTRLLREQQQIFAADPDAAIRLLAVGETRNDASLPGVELAARTVLGKALLSHDEAVMRR